MTPGAWAIAGALVKWLDDNSVSDRETDRILRCLKLAEEVGEVSQAIIGATGQTPRKGVTHTWNDVEAELCDVIVTAMVALRTINPLAGERFAQHMRQVATRAHVA